MEAESEHTPSQTDEIRSALISWYSNEHRTYPWRETTDPYSILVCEVMSQQTQLDRVVTPYSNFLNKWPTVADLAEADRAEVVRFWSQHSLGYNNRAKYLHKAANQIISDFDGSFPQQPKLLEELMGVGPYTANAVASFAFNKGNAVVDTNVKRVLYRAFDVPDEEEAFELAANALLPPSQSRVWNNAIMELGALACQKTPNCDDANCPWRYCCTAYQTGDFGAPDIPTQDQFEGSRRQYRGRIIRVLGEKHTISRKKLGHQIRVDYDDKDSEARAWLESLIDDLAADGLVTKEQMDDELNIRLKT